MLPCAKADTGLDGIRIFDGIQDIAHICSCNIGSGHFEGNSFSKVNQSWNNQTGKAGECSCTKEKYHGSTGNLTGGFNTSDAADSHNNGTEYKWKDHHIQGIHVDAAEKTGNCQNRCKTVRKKQSGQDTEKQADKDRTGNMLLIPGIKFFSFFLLLKKVVCLAEILLNIQNITKIIACTRIWCQEILQYYNIEGISLEKFYFIS